MVWFGFIYGVLCHFQQYFSYIVAGSFIGGGNQGTQGKTTDKLYLIMLLTSLWSGYKLTTSVVIDTDCIGSFKSNYHTITATVAHLIKINIQVQQFIFFFL